MRSRALAFVLLGIGVAVGVAAASWPASPRAVSVTGYAGQRGEWELTATLARTGPPWWPELSGPLKMLHVGTCSQDGPEERKGEMRLRLSSLTSRLEASLTYDGVECAYAGDKSDVYHGMIVCPDRRPVPLMLWMK